MFETGVMDCGCGAGDEVAGVILIRFPSDSSCSVLDVDGVVLLLGRGCDDASWA